METQTAASLHLSADEQDIAARLANYSRKIRELRRLDAPVSEGLTSAEGLETPDKASRRRRAAPLRSVAEDYRHARQIQRLLQVVGSAQIVLTTILASMSSFVIELYVFGYACGVAASALG